MPGEFPPQPLDRYALLADGERGALVGPFGDITWMCAPRWDSGAVFSTLIGGRGVYAVTPVARHIWGGRYEEGSLIWRTRWITEEGVFECREALAFPADPHRVVILRRVLASPDRARLAVVLEPRADFGEGPLRALAEHDGVWTGAVGELRMRWSGGANARPAGPEGHRLTMDLTVEPGTHHDLVLEISDRELPPRPPEPARCWAETEAAWERAVPRLQSTVAPRDARQSYAVLRGLTARSGGVVAAATTSLPERAGEERNYDYRYVWIRDLCIAGQAVAADEAHPLLDDAVRFATARLLDDGPGMAPVYTAEGRGVPGQHRLELPGYPGGHDLVGNRGGEQFQLDVFGESLLLLAAAARHDRLDDDGRRAAETAAQAIGRRWREPDSGMWELSPRHWAHSRLICAAGLRAMARAGPSTARTARWTELADALIADTDAHSRHPSGRWQRSPGDPGLDGALLLPLVRGALPVDDPRNTATLRAYTRRLADDHFAYRFRHDGRPLNEAEGAFLLCGFAVALAQHRQGHEVEAYRWFERNRAACGPAGLYSEEYDVGLRQMRGNLPQAFVHALMLECAVRLNRPWGA